MDKLAETHQKLSTLQEKFEAGQTVAKSNRDAAIALCHFIFNTINTIDPDRIEACWLGSYSNPCVTDYPNVMIYAVHRLTGATLAKWYINTKGQYPPPNITAGDIVKAVSEGGLMK